MEPPDPSIPNQFSLAGDGVLEELLADAGFLEVKVAPVAMQRAFASLDQYLAEMARDVAVVRRDGQRS